MLLYIHVHKRQACQISSSCFHPLHSPFTSTLIYLSFLFKHPSCSSPLHLQPCPHLTWHLLFSCATPPPFSNTTLWSSPVFSQHLSGVNHGISISPWGKSSLLLLTSCGINAGCQTRRGVSQLPRTDSQDTQRVESGEDNKIIYITV